MKYYVENENGKMEEKEEELTCKTVKHYLEFIKRGYLPDYNYTHDSKDGSAVRPDENFPLHMAMYAAIKAIESMEKNDKFFAEINDKANIYSNDY